MSITRRNAITGAATIATVAAIPVTVQASETTGAISTAIRQRYAEWQTARKVFHGAIDNLGDVETRTRDALIARGLEFGTEDYWGAWHKSGVDAASDMESRTSGECNEAFARLLNTAAASVQDMALKRRAMLVQQGYDSEPSDSTKLIEALGRDFERLAKTA